MRQAHEVEFGFGVQATDLLGRVRAQHAVRADHAHDQVIAHGIEHVDVEFCMGRGKAGAHFLGKDLVAQALRFGHFILVARPRNGQNRLVTRRNSVG